MGQLATKGGVLLDAFFAHWRQDSFPFRDLERSYVSAARVARLSAAQLAAKKNVRLKRSRFLGATEEFKDLTGHGLCGEMPEGEDSQMCCQRARCEAIELNHIPPQKPETTYHISEYLSSFFWKV